MNEPHLIQQLQQWRPASWEDDIGVNSLDQKQFHNAPSPAGLNQDKLHSAFEDIVPGWLRDGIDLPQLINNDRCPLPGNEDRESYFPDFHERFWVSGLDDYLRIRFVLKKHNCTPGKVFELGAASGRIVRHLAAHGKFSSGEPFADIWCCDINYRHTRWMIAYLHQTIRVFHNSTLPHLPLDSNSLDLVCAFSVFTHIDTFELQWIAELHRILAPGAIAYITIHSEHCWQELANRPKHQLHSALSKINGFEPSDLKKPMSSERMVFRFDDLGPYRSNVFHSESYIRKHWSRFFEIIEFLPLFHSNFQTVVVLKKLV